MESPPSVKKLEARRLLSSDGHRIGCIWPICLLNLQEDKPKQRKYNKWVRKSRTGWVLPSEGAHSTAPPTDQGNPCQKSSSQLLSKNQHYQNQWSQSLSLSSSSLLHPLTRASPTKIINTNYHHHHDHVIIIILVVLRIIIFKIKNSRSPEDQPTHLHHFTLIHQYLSAHITTIMHDAHYRLLCIPFSQMAYIPLPSNSAYKHPQELHGHGMRRAT